MIIAFAPKHNTKGRKDATGAFIPEAKRFMAYHDDMESVLYIIDNSKSKQAMKKQVFDALRKNAWRQVRCIAFFCHGYRSGLQFGFKLRDCDELAKALYTCGGKDVSVPLYACDTARDTDRNRSDDLEVFGGDGGFADTLRDSLCKAGATWCRVDAHTTAGHTTRNPHVRRFRGDGSVLGSTGGFYIVPRKNRKAFRAWRLMLRTEFRYEFPFLSIGEIHQEVNAALQK